MSISQLRRAGHFPTLVGALIYFDVSFMVWTLLGALGPYVAADLGLTSAQKGLMIAVPVLGGAVLRVVMGFLADRHGARRLGLSSLALTVVPLLWGALAGNSYVQVLGIGLLLGVAGASFAVALPLASRWYPPAHQGLALGIVGMGNSGTLIAALVAPRLAERIGWHGAFAVAILPVVAAWIAFGMLCREPPAPVGSPNRAEGWSFPLSGDAAWLAAFYAVTFGGFVGLAGYLPIFFVDSFGLSKVSAAGFAALCAAMGSALRPVGGLLADRLGGTRVLAVVLTTVAALALLVAASPGLALTVVLLMGMMGTLGTGNGAVFQLVPRRFPDQVGAVTGVVGAVGGVGGFVLPLALGVLHGTTGGFGAGFLVLSVAALATAAAAGLRDRVWRPAGWQLETSS